MCVSISNDYILNHFGSLIFFCFRLPHKFIQRWIFLRRWLLSYFTQSRSLLLKSTSTYGIECKLFRFLIFLMKFRVLVSQFNIVCDYNCFVSRLALFWLLVFGNGNCLHRCFSRCFSLFPSKSISYFHVCILVIYLALMNASYSIIDPSWRVRESFSTLIPKS